MPLWLSHPLRIATVCCLLGLVAFPSPSPAREDEKGHLARGEHPMKKVDVRANPEDADVWTFTLESDVYRANLYLNPVLDYSSRAGWDVQIASYNIPTYGAGTPGDWDSFIILSKTFAIGGPYKLTLGTQNGTSFSVSSRQYQNFDYGLITWQPVDLWNLHAGPYFANAALAGVGRTVGFAAGFSLNLLEDLVTLQGDYFSGHSSLSGAIVNVFVNVSTGVRAYVGVGVPEQNSGSEFYGALGFSLSSKAF